MTNFNKNLYYFFAVTSLMHIIKSIVTIFIYSFDKNFVLSTINRRCVPSPISFSPQYAAILNSIFLPSTLVTTASALTTSPIFDGFTCDDSICPPTVV